MEPALPEGTIVLVRRTQAVQLNDIILCRHPYKSKTNIIKRVEDLRPDGLYVLGDNPSQSTDSRSFGVIPTDHVLGVVTSKMTV